MEMRRLKDQGFHRMVSFLDSLTTELPQAYPASVLTDPAMSEALPVAIEIEQREFPRRFDLAQYTYEHLIDSGLHDPAQDAGLWAWLALLWFEELCPTGRGGERRPGERARWIPRLDSARRYYRHLVLGPYLVYKAHSDDPNRALCALCQSPHAPGDVVEQIASRPQLVTSQAVVGAATRLYCNTDGNLRRGAGGKGPGSARRLGDVVMQLDRTYDLHTLDTQHLLSLLPREFNRFQA